MTPKLTDERSIVRLGRSQRQLHIIDLPYLYVDPLVGRLAPRMSIVFVTNDDSMCRTYLCSTKPRSVYNHTK